MRLRGQPEAEAGTREQRLTLPLDQASADSIRFLLRRETRSEHAVLDQHPDFAALVEGTLGLEGYRRLMRRIHALYRGLDGPIARACVLHGLDRHGFAYAPRTPMLARDIAGLGLREDLHGVFTPHLDLDTPWRLAGALYVIEGSVLGGSMLSLATQTLLDESGAAANAYWQWCRREGAARWSMTCRMLDAMGAHEAKQSHMVDGARATFAAFAAALDPRRDAAHPEPTSSC